MTLIMIATAIAITAMLTIWITAMNEELTTEDSLWAALWNPTLPTEEALPTHEVDVSEFDLGATADYEFAISHIAIIRDREEARIEGRDLGLRFRLAEIRSEHPRAIAIAHLAQEIRSENASLTNCPHCNDGWDQEGEICMYCEGLGQIDLTPLFSCRTEVLINDIHEDEIPSIASWDTEIDDDEDMDWGFQRDFEDTDSALAFADTRISNI